MNSLSEHAKKELVDALQGRESEVFLINGKLFSIEVENENEEIREDYSDNLSNDIEEYPELKASLFDYIESNLSQSPYIGLAVESGSFRGLRRITYGKSKHVMLNYIIYYAVHENDGY